MPATRQPCPPGRPGPAGRAPGALVGAAGRAGPLLGGGWLAGALLAASPAQAQTGLTVSADQQLRFGSLVVPTSGSRTVSAAGAVSDVGLVPVSGASPSPAQFTITYQRSGLVLPIILVTQITMASVPTINLTTVKGSLSNFATDLPGSPTLTPGQGQVVNWQLCITATCTLTFHVGGTLSISSATGGASIAVPLPITASVIGIL